MKQLRTIQSLSTLVALRDRDVDRLTAEVAAKQLIRERFQGNLERMARLCTDSGASGTPSPAQALNKANYKAAVMQMADLHRQDLALHEAQMALSERALQEAACRREVLGQLLSKQQLSLRKAESSREQKRQDDLATQVWLRGQA